MQSNKHLRIKEKSDEDEDTPLHFVAAAGKTTALFNYLSLGSDANCENHLGWTPVMLAARNGHADCVKLLSDFGADLLRRNRFGICSLSLAVASGNLATVKYILNKLIKKRVNLLELATPVSPIVFAILFDHAEILQYLLRKGFNIHATSAIGDIPTVAFRSATNSKRTMDIVEHFSPTNLERNFEESNTTPRAFLPIPKYSHLNKCLSPVCSPILYLSPYYAQQSSRKCSNLSPSLIPNTPDVSPILSASSPTLFPYSFPLSAFQGSPKNDYLNKRFSLPKHGHVNKVEDTCDRSAKVRSHSCNVQTQPTSTSQCEDLEDDVFDTNASSSKNREFIELLRKHSLDSCVELFERHEIDMDVFRTLSKGDLDEIGINWDKRADILELIYLLNK